MEFYRLSFWSWARGLVGLQASYDVTRDTDQSRNHWANARGETVQQLTTLGNRKSIRDRARYEVRNNSYASGVGHTLANMTIGTGPRLQVVDHPNRQQIEKDFQSWMRRDSVAEKLRQQRFARYESGEGFLVRSFDVNAAEDEVSLTVLPIECDRITDPRGGGNMLIGADGINLDNYGNPVSYSVRDEIGWKWVTAPADFVIHYFRADRPGQRRGISEVAPALPLFAQMRAYTLSVIACAESAARPGGVLQSSEIAADEDLDEEPETYDKVDVPVGSLLVLPKNRTLSQLKPEQPTTTYPEFKREILSEAGRCVGVPANVMLGDSSAYNFASGRLDHQTFFIAIGVERKFIERVILSRVFSWWWEEYRVLTGLQGPAPQTRYYWDAVPHVDPGKEANAQSTRLASGTTTLAIEFGESGIDWEEALEQRAIEAARIKELETQYGVKLTTEQTTPQGNAPDGNQDPQDSQDEPAPPTPRRSRSGPPA